MEKEQKESLIKIIVAGALLVVAIFLPVKGMWRLAAFLVPYIVIGYESILEAVEGIKEGELLDENFLMSIATIGAFVIAVINGSGDYADAVFVMLFYRIGEFFEDYAIDKSRDNISELMDVRPDYANLAVGEGEPSEIRTVNPAEVKPGSIIVVRPGEKIPIDGTVIGGESELNTAALTGESILRSVSAGDEVLSGCINESGVLRIRTTREFGESTVSRILELVENAAERKAGSEAFITKFARVYTPAVCIAALVLGICPPLVRLLVMHLPPMWSDWVYRALEFLVISCPCALVMSIPLSFFAGIGCASHNGILIKGSNYLEALAEAKTVVFDKTGTLTEGSFEVESIHCAKDIFAFVSENDCTMEEGDEHECMTRTENMLLEYAAYAEKDSLHPIALSIKRAYGKEIDAACIEDVKEVSGQGITAKIKGHRVACGNSKLMESIGILPDACEDLGTILHVAVDGRYFGHIHISDRIKNTSASAIDLLKRLGVRKTIVLTGDSEKVASAVADKLGINEVYSEMLPADKVDKIEKLLEGVADDSFAESGRKGKLVFVGDGINDAPVLMRADIGIAMGALGRDAAIEAADVVLMDDDPAKIALAIQISRKCIRIVYENIWFAIGVKIICLLLGALGIATMWMAIFADVGVMVIAVLNALRALKVSGGASN